MNINDITIGQIIVVVSAIVALFKFLEWTWNKFVEPHLKHEQVLTQTEKDIKEIKEMLKNDYQKLIDHDTRLTRLELVTKESEDDRRDLHESVRVTMVALQALLKSSIDKDANINGIQKAESEIERYMQSKI